MALLFGLGCHPHGKPLREPSSEQRCYDGDASGCLEAAREHEAGPSSEPAIELVERACSMDSPQGCFQAGQTHRERDQPGRARTMYARGCRLGHEPSCEERGRHDIRSALLRHPWLWACAQQAGGSPGDAETVHIRAGNAGTVAKVVLDAPLPERPQLQECIRDALAATTISTRYAMSATQVRMDLSLDPLVVEDMVRGTADRGLVTAMRRRVNPAHEDDPAAACPGHRRSTCESLAAKQIDEKAIWTPDPEKSALAQTYVPGTPTQMFVSIDYCVDQRTGKTIHTRRVDSVPPSATADLFVEQISKWRFKIWSRDVGEVCSRIHYEVRFKWRGRP